MAQCALPSSGTRSGQQGQLRNVAHVNAFDGATHGGQSHPQPGTGFNASVVVPLWSVGLLCGICSDTPCDAPHGLLLGLRFVTRGETDRPCLMHMSVWSRSRSGLRTQVHGPWPDVHEQADPIPSPVTAHRAPPPHAPCHEWCDMMRYANQKMFVRPSYTMHYSCPSG